MTTDNQDNATTNRLINRLASLADNYANHVDSTSRVKAAVMVAYLSGRPEPTGGVAREGFSALQKECGIRLTGDGS